MHGSSKKPKTVPTVRYRILAVVFFLLAAGGLFLGLLIPHLAVVPDPLGLNIAFGAGSILTGSLLGYVIDVMKFIFTKGFPYTGTFSLLVGIVALC